MRYRYNYNCQESKPIKGLASCPCCQGKGLASFIGTGKSTALYNTEKTIECPICTTYEKNRGWYGTHRETADTIEENKVIARIEALTNAFSGKALVLRTMSACDIENVYLGPAGQEYRRLMNYLWSMTAAERGVSNQSHIGIKTAA